MSQTGRKPPTFASGEEKTIVKLPQGYGAKVGGDEFWGLNYMIHSLNQIGGREVQITWEIDWVPETTPARTDINPTRVQWLDVAGAPQLYPVFDAERGFDTNGDGKYVFPDEVPTDPNAPGFEERSSISPNHRWVVPAGGRTLVFGSGHLHPGGLHVDLQVARDGPDAGEVNSDDPSEVRQLFRSNAKYYEPAGAVSWDVSMEVTRPEWRISLKGGDTVSINTTYDVEKASWYESMGILPLAVAGAGDPAARDPFDDAAAVQAMYDQGGILTHGRLPENIDAKAGKKLKKIPNPLKLASKGKRVPEGGLTIDGFDFSVGGYPALGGGGFFFRNGWAPGDQARRDGGLHEPRRPPGPARPTADLAQRHVMQGALQPRRGDRLPARRRPDQVRLGPARLRHPRELRGDDGLEHLHDTAADEARQDLLVLLQDPSVHARLDPRQGHEEQGQRRRRQQAEDELSGGRLGRRVGRLRGAGLARQGLEHEELDCDVGIGVVGAHEGDHRALDLLSIRAVRSFCMISW